MLAVYAKNRLSGRAGFVTSWSAKSGAIKLLSGRDEQPVTIDPTWLDHPEVFARITHDYFPKWECEIREM